MSETEDRAMAEIAMRAAFGALKKAKRGLHPGPTTEQRLCRHPHLRWYHDVSGRFCADCHVDERDFFREKD